jgi:hypothetical protein
VIDATGFDGNLASSGATNVQRLAQAVDDLTVGGGVLKIPYSLHTGTMTEGIAGARFINWVGNFNSGIMEHAASRWNPDVPLIITNLSFQFQIAVTSVGTNWTLYAVTNLVKSQPLLTLIGTTQGTTSFNSTNWTTESFTALGVTNVGWFLTNSGNGTFASPRVSIFWNQLVPQ